MVLEHHRIVLSAQEEDTTGEGVLRDEAVEARAQAPRTTLLDLLLHRTAHLDGVAADFVAGPRHHRKSEAEVVVGHQQTPPLNLVHPSLSYLQELDYLKQKNARLDSIPIADRFRTHLSQWQETKVASLISKGLRLNLSKPLVGDHSYPLPPAKQPIQQDLKDYLGLGALEEILQECDSPVPPLSLRETLSWEDLDYQQRTENESDPELEPSVLPSFVVPKKRGGRRFILDARALNRLTPIPPSFIMEGVNDIEIFIQAGYTWGTSLDMQDAYLHVPLSRSLRKILRSGTRWRSNSQLLLSSSLGS